MDDTLFHSHVSFLSLNRTRISHTIHTQIHRQKAINLPTAALTLTTTTLIAADSACRWKRERKKRV